ncbi:MAG: hypothetical protein R2818_15820 [Flavobacteriales bacterium]
MPGPEGRGKVVMVTSYRPNEGKTFCSVNLERSQGRPERKCFLLKWTRIVPKVGVGLGMTSQTGLSTVPIGKMNWREAALPTQFEHFTDVGRLTPPNASEAGPEQAFEEPVRGGVEGLDYATSSIRPRSV